jgi:hypothetical protein
MAYPGSLHDLKQEFRREHKTLSCSLDVTVEWLHVNHAYRINNDLRYWIPFPQMFAAAVASKTIVPLEFVNVTSSLDETNRSICRPSDREGGLTTMDTTERTGSRCSH